MKDVLYGIKLVVLEELDPATQLPKASGGITCRIDTGEEAEIEPVVSEGKEEVKRSATKILAVVREDDLVYGADVKFTDNTFDPEVAFLIEGGKIRRNSETQEIEGFDASLMSEGATMKPFKCTIYTANYEGDSIKDYLKISFNNCTGKASKMKIGKDFYSPEFEIKAREATKAGLAYRTYDIVTKLPEPPKNPGSETVSQPKIEGGTH